MKNWVYGLINWSYVCLQLLGFFPKLTLIFHVSWYVSLSPGIARQLQTTPVVFPFLYLNRGDAFRCWLFGACIPCLIARAGYQISCPQISYPEKDTIQSWTVGTFLEKKKQNRCCWCDNHKVHQREFFHFVMYFPIWPWKSYRTIGFIFHK